MIVLVLSGVPSGLRGEVTRWLLEIAPGVFVGHLSARVRENLWKRIEGGVRQGRATLVFSVRGEQRLSFLTCGEPWEPVDFDGIRLVRRVGRRNGPSVDASTGSSSSNEGWSIAARRRRFLNSIERRTHEMVRETNLSSPHYDENQKS